MRNSFRSKSNAPRFFPSPAILPAPLRRRRLIKRTHRPVRYSKGIDLGFLEWLGNSLFRHNIRSLRLSFETPLYLQEPAKTQTLYNAKFPRNPRAS